MMILDGKIIKNIILDELREEVSKLSVKPKLVVIQVGNNPASTVYVNNKKKACEFCGIKSLSYELEKDMLDSIPLVDVLVNSKLITSKSEARRMIEGGGVYLNEEKVSDFRQVLKHSDLIDGYCLLRKGKKNYMKVTTK